MSSASIEENDHFVYSVLIALIVSWIMITVCTILRATGSLKVFCFAFTVLVIFFIGGITLAGDVGGMNIISSPPTLLKFTNAELWFDAAAQCFLSLGVGFGRLITLSSRNSAHSSYSCSIWIIGLVDVVSSMWLVQHSSIYFCYRQFFHSLVTFVVFLFKSIIYKKENCYKRDTGIGIIFTTLTEAMTKFPGSKIWAMLLFSMLIVLGFDFEARILEGVVISLRDFKLFSNMTEKNILLVSSSRSCLPVSDNTLFLSAA